MQANQTQQTAWITGAAGLIGNQIAKAASRYAGMHHVVGLTRDSLDLTRFEAVRARFNREQPSLLIHCAAMSQSTRCEREPDRARRVNVDSTAFLAELFVDGRVVFFSTDLVFNGRKGDYTEDDETDPLGVYAETKLQAERIVAGHPNHVIIRTSLNGGTSLAGNRGFNEALQVTWKAGRTPSLFVDELRCPIPAPVTARATWELALSRARGIHHVAGSERLSRWQIGRLVAARHPELRPQIQAGTLKDYPGPPRAADCSLNVSRAQRVLSFRLPGLTEWLESNPTEPF